ncbi:glycosyl transferase family 1 [Gemmatimonadetes bacterium T265]|nr:glycosyl transferase family 1 [Gemmatimonadetes bacterium T265]
MTRDDAPRRRLLYVSPVLPATGGNGLAMRAGAVLEVLARRYAVTLVVAPLYPPLYGPPLYGKLAPELAALCERVAVLPPPHAGVLPAWVGRLGRLLARLHPARAGAGASPEPRSDPLPYAAERFDAVHVFRLSMVALGCRYAAALAAHGPELHLDLDDVESDVLGEMAELHRAGGRGAAAEAADRAARRARAQEDEVLATFDRVYVCSDADRERLAPRAHAQLCVLPNTVAGVRDVAPAPPREPFQFLFVGTLGYWPNADAVAWLCDEIVPLIERLAARDFRVVVAGGGAPPSLSRLARPPRVTFAGRVPDVAALYREAGAAIVPLRAGGGTRIKVLEAFAHGRPVVATSPGIAGIDARDGEHALVADTSSALAARCAWLMRDAALGRRLTAAALELVRRRYSVDAVAAALDTVPSPRWPRAPTGRQGAPARAAG